MSSEHGRSGVTRLLLSAINQTLLPVDDNQEVVIIPVSI